LLAGRPTPPATLEAAPFVVGDVAFFADFVGAFFVPVPASRVRGLALRPGAAVVGPGTSAKAGTVLIVSATGLTVSGGTGGRSMPFPS
jgi:hypothetical protein